MASCAAPGMFPYEKWGDKTFVDGCMLRCLDIIGGIEHCLDKGFKEQDIIIDSILSYR